MNLSKIRSLAPDVVAKTVIVGAAALTGAVVALGVMSVAHTNDRQACVTEFLLAYPTWQTSADAATSEAVPACKRLSPSERADIAADFGRLIVAATLKGQVTSP